MYFNHMFLRIRIDTGTAHVRFLAEKIALIHYLFKNFGFFSVQNHATSYSCFIYLPTTPYNLTT